MFGVLIRGVESSMVEGVTAAAAPAAAKAGVLTSGNPMLDLFILIGVAAFALLLIGAYIVSSGKGRRDQSPLEVDLQKLSTQLESLSASASSLISIRDSQIEFLKQEILLIREELQLQRHSLEELIRKAKDSSDYSRPLSSSAPRWSESETNLDAILSGRTR